jgi:hypothetical protein
VLFLGDFVRRGLLVDAPPGKAEHAAKRSISSHGASALLVWWKTIQVRPAFTEAKIGPFVDYAFSRSASKPR